MLDSYKKYKKETQVIVGISAIPIGRIRMTNQELAGGVPYAFIPLCDSKEGPCCSVFYALKQTLNCLQHTTDKHK